MNIIALLHALRNDCLDPVKGIIRKPHKELHALIEIVMLLEEKVETIADLNTKLDAVKTSVDALIAEVAALKNAPPAVATQADLDGLGAKVDALHAALNG